jgi:glycosyltransferase involved in cell wall biosynthesis
MIRSADDMPTSSPRLLILTPGELTRDPRARRAAAAAAARGWDVVGVCLGRGEPLALDGVSVVRVPVDRVTTALRGAGLGGTTESHGLVRELRGLYRLGRLLHTTLRLATATRRLGRFDVVHANDLDTLPASWLAARRSGARLVYDAHELYTLQEPDPPQLHRRVAATLEGALARRAATVITVSDLIAEELRRQLRLTRGPLVVLNCPDRDGSEPAPGTGPLKAVYQGAMGPGRPIADLLDAAGETEGVELTLRIAGANLYELRREIERRGLASVRVVEPVSPDRLVDALGEFEAGVIINRPVTRNDELVFPNKLFEYLMAGLAVVAPRLPGLAPVVEDEGIGLTFAPGDPLDLGRALTALAADRDRLLELRRRARALALERYNADVQAETLAAAWGR